MFEASIEYEKCLEDSKDVKTKQNCLKALSYIKNRTGDKMSDDTEKLLAEQVQKTDSLLLEQGRQRLSVQESNVEKARLETITKARVKANHIKNVAKEQAAAATANSNWMVLDHDYNYKPAAYPIGTENKITDEANAKADSVRAVAQKAADSMKSPNQDEVTEALRSQLKVNAATSKFRMSPVGTNVYVRNYRATPNKSNVATSPSSSVK